MENEVNLNFYTEKSTRFIYEVQFFDDFVIVRPASPDFYQAIRQLSWDQFSVEFDEYSGDRAHLAAFLHGYVLDDDEGPDEVTLMD